MKVITFNLRCVSDPNGNSIDERAPRLKEVLSKYDGDLIGFQEVTPRWLEHLTEDYGDEYEIFIKYRAESNKEATPMMWKKSKFDCLDKGYFWFSDAPDIESKGWDTLGCYRICLWAKLRYKPTGVVFTYFNTHYGFSDSCQLKSGKLILDHIKATGETAAIVTADFNMYPSSPGYKQLTEKFVDVNAETAKDFRLTCHGYDLNRERPGPIDFCFVTPATITPLSSKRMDDLVDGKFPSDHYGVCSEVDIRADVKLATFNLCVSCPHEDRGSRLRGLMRKYKPDIIGFQEVGPKWLPELEKMTDYDFVYQYRGEKALEATPICWRKDTFELVEARHFWLSDTPDQESMGWEGHYLRICTVAILRHKATGKKICHVNTHFDFTPENHVRSAALIKERIKEFEDLPIFCTADYNMTVGSPGYRAMTETFTDLRMALAPLDYTPTFVGYDPVCAPGIIDYIFTNGKGIRPLTYQVIDDRPKKERLSDHNGIICSFTLENE